MAISALRGMLPFRIADDSAGDPRQEVQCETQTLSLGSPAVPQRWQQPGPARPLGEGPGGELLEFKGVVATPPCWAEYRNSSRPEYGNSPTTSPMYSTARTARQKSRHPVSTHGTAQGKLMRLVAAGLAGRGFDVHYAEHEDGRRLTITGLPSMKCTLTVDDDGTVRWQYWPEPGHQADPGRVANLALNVLVPDSDHSTHTTAPDGDSLRLGVGQALRAAGLDVDIDVYTDQDTFTVTAEIVAVNPVNPERGEIRIDDSARITWECGYDTEAVPVGTIAETVVSILSNEIVGGSAIGEDVQRASDDQACRGSADA
jgi:hypothetical protein